MICTSGHHSALLHPSPSVREALADLRSLTWHEAARNPVAGMLVEFRL